MRQDIKDRWLDALESGKYKQGVGVLHGKDGTFCCLGVLCDLWVEDTGNLWAMSESAEEMVGIYDADTGVLECALPPLVVMDWAGMESSPGYTYLTDDEQVINKLAVANDDRVPFKEIAETIRASFQGEV